MVITVVSKTNESAPHVAKALDRCFVVSDAAPVAGLEPGMYNFFGKVRGCQWVPVGVCVVVVRDSGSLA